MEPVVRVDAQQLTDAVHQAANTIDRNARSAVVTIRDAKVVVTGGQPGIVIDVSATSEQLRAVWPLQVTLEPVATVTQPGLSTVDAEAFQVAMNKLELATDITLTGPNGDIVLAPAEWAQFATIDTSTEKPRLVVDGKGLAQFLLAAHPGLNNDARGSSVFFDASHVLQVDKGQPGREIDVSGLGRRVLVAAGTVTRSATMPYTITAVEPPAKNVNIDDFVERVSSFTTSFTPRGWAREKNIGQAASYVSGTIVKPGETFSLGDTISPVESSRGYVAAGAIVDGQHVDVMGGGLSQMATTMYNAAYWSGVDLVEYKAHSEWFSRYPAGRESTLFLPSLDMKWTNDTPYAILINAYVEDAKIHVDFWSTPYYVVDGSSSTTPPAGWGVGCAKPGFTITDYRKVSLNGTVVKDEPRRWTYKSVDFCSE